MPVIQSSSMAHLATDPIRNFKFQVTIEKFPNLAFGFMAISGWNITTEVISYREGGMNSTTQKMPGQSDFSPITLSRGLAVGNPQDMLWMKQLFTVIQGTGNFGANNDFRSNVDVAILGHPVTTATAPVVARFKVFNAWPTTQAFSDLDAGASQLVVGQLALAHEGWDWDVASALNQDAALLPNARV